MKDIYQSVTDAIVAAIEQGQTAEKLQMPWAGALTLPKNAATGKMYRGINIPVLWAQQQTSGLISSKWGTYKQWQELDAQVKKGSKGTRIIFWKLLKKKNKEETYPLARWSTIFNSEQVEGYESPEIQTVGTAEQIAEVEKFVTDTEAVIEDGKGQAYYSPPKDVIGMPDIELFHDTKASSATENYYSTLLHELTHWTGAKHRLDRSKKSYPFEELIAELGAAMLCAKLGITSSTRPDHAQYIDGWLKALKDDKKLIFSAASLAQKAVDYLLPIEEEDGTNLAIQ